MEVTKDAMIELPVIRVDGPGDRRAWRSIAHRDGHPGYGEFTAGEFIPGASDPPEHGSRRRFIQIMGASMALAGLTGCRKPVEAILPYTRKPEEIIPGLPLEYATSMPFRGLVRGLLVESREGRPTKVEGNPEHPHTRGKSGVFEQASILNLYDPDRSQVVTRDGVPATWQEVSALLGVLRNRSARVAIIIERSSSLTRQAVRSEIERQNPNVSWVEYTAEGDDNEALGLRSAFGRSVRPRHVFSKANVILSLDDDFLNPAARNFIDSTREFSEARRVREVGDVPARLYVAESYCSITGGMADHRLRLRSSDIPYLSTAIAARLGIAGTSESPYRDHPWVAAVSDDLRSAGANAIVVAGETQPPEIHALAAAMNDALGSVGTTLELLEDDSTSSVPMNEEFAGIAAAMRNGLFDAALLIGVNPVYDAPAELDFASALSAVPETIHVGLHVDESATACRWHVPMSHYLETWGDGRSYDGTASIIQPLIAPLYPSKSAVEVLDVLATGRDRAGYDVVRENWRSVLGNSNFEKEWRKVLHDGFASVGSYTSVAPGASTPDLSGIPNPPSANAIEIVYRLSPAVLDGSFANNVWLQELPDPTTKIVWDNVAVMSEATAERLGIDIRLNGGKYYVDMVEIEVGGRTVTIPAWIQTGVADNSITLYLGYGRQIQSDRNRRSTNFFDLDDYTDIYGQGAVATGVGVNVAPLRRRDFGRVETEATVRRVPARYLIATTQDHGAQREDLQQVERREPVRVGTVEEYRRNPTFAADAEPPIPGGEPWAEYPELWERSHPKDQPQTKGNLYEKYQWGMVFDLNACTGCNSCVVACQSENNVQAVGKEEVALGREMHWIRLDRYYVHQGDGGGEPEMVVQPVPCMHCENAPCEAVCPVAATVHSPDGTNQMIYNRCIGTRYCANNCPYKVRRFNFYNWTKTLPMMVHMAHNPEVTVRFRGVMEKCSYCIQRIRAANVRSNIEDRPIVDGEVQTACQQACPAEAITFGDVSDPDTDVSRDRNSDRRYDLLAQLSVKPRTSYLARIKNPNPRLANTNES